MDAQLSKSEEKTGQPSPEQNSYYNRYVKLTRFESGKRVQRNLKTRTLRKQRVRHPILLLRFDV